MSLIPLEENPPVEEGPEKVEEVKLQRREEETEEPKRLRVAGEAVQEAILLKEGMCIEGRVKGIRRGLFKDFVPEPEDPERRKRWLRRAYRPAYLFIIETPIGEVRDVVVVSGHPSSRMAQLTRCYSRIRVGDKVKLCVENGRLKITC